MRYLLPLLLAVSSFAQTPTILNPEFLNLIPTDTSPANNSWGSYKFSADFVPPFNYELTSILIGHHDWRANAYTPRNSIVSSSSALLIGWTTPTNADCILFGCQIANGQAALTLSMKAMNTYSPTVGIISYIYPGVDQFNGVWGWNANISNNFHTNSGGSGMLGGEINIGLDDVATDVPDPGYPGQSIGFTVTESSFNTTNKGVSTAYGMAAVGTQNFHHGIWVGANPRGQRPMGDIIRASGPITTSIDLSRVQSGPVALAMPPKGGLTFGRVGLPSELPPNTPASTAYWCVRCAKNSDPCAIGSTQALAVSTGAGYRCY